MSRGDPGNRLQHLTRARWLPAWDENGVWVTPDNILEAARRAFGVAAFALDPCTEPDNPTGALEYVALPRDGLAVPWGDGPVWVNPPFGAGAIAWAKRAIECGQAGGRVALLLPAATETRIGSAVVGGADLVTFLRGRPAFARPRRDGRPFATMGGVMLATWNVRDAGPLLELGPTLARMSSGWLP